LGVPAAAGTHDPPPEQLPHMPQLLFVQVGNVVVVVLVVVGVVVVVDVVGSPPSVSSVPPQLGGVGFAATLHSTASTFFSSVQSFFLVALPGFVWVA
jgi:hypothetical protein